ncbi:MAG: nickel pincer cofactor biosynthesis protein LarC2, partial [Myxococcaceae bacterium]
VTLKKSRPGHVLSVLVAGAEREQVVRRLLTESPTLGVRAWPVHRTVLDRAHVQVETPHGPVRVKVGSLDGETLNAAPEFEDVRARAEATGVPFKQVWAEALAAYSRRP